MDLSQMVALGKVAGIGGIAVGAVVLLLRPVIEQSAHLPEPMRGWLLLIIAIGALVLCTARDGHGLIRASRAGAGTRPSPAVSP